MNERGAWKVDAAGGFTNFTEGDSYDTAAMDSLGDINTRRNGPDARAPRKPKMIIEWFGEAADSALSEPVNPLIEDLLDEGALSVIYGDSGSGKTFAALDMTFHVSAGLDWNGKKVKRGLAVYVAAEGGRRIKRRIAALKKRIMKNMETMRRSRFLPLSATKSTFARFP
jgi:hypothetical protein